MLPIQGIASGVLAAVIRRQPASPARTAFAWTAAVGPALSRAATADLRDGVVWVTPKDARWSPELERAASTILIRLQALLGPEVSAIRILPPALTPSSSSFRS